MEGGELKPPLITVPLSLAARSQAPAESAEVMVIPRPGENARERRLHCQAALRLQWRLKIQ